MMLRRSLRPAALLLALAAPLALVAAVVRAAPQEAADLPPLVEEIKVEVVNVDVVVTDRRGNPVTGLTRDDFVLYEDGKQRPITNFYAFDEGRARFEAGGAAPEQAAEETRPDPTTRRRMVLLFDSNSLEKRARNQAIDALERFILEQFDGTYEWAVIAYSERLQLMEPFTSSKTRVLAALSKVRDLPIAVRRARAGDPLEAEEPIVRSRAQGLTEQPGSERSNEPRQLTTLEFGTRARMFAGIRSFSVTTAAMVQTMRAFSGLPGRKALVLVSGELESLPSAAQLLGRGFPGAGSDNRLDPLSSVLHTELLTRFKLIVQTANATGFAIYPVSSFGYISSDAPYLDVERHANLAFKGGFSSMPAAIDVDTAPRVIAEGTGGEYYTTTHFYNAFDDIDSRTANAYVLGFQTDRDPDGKYHRLRVEVTRHGLEVKSREGYLHATRESRLVTALTTPLTFPKDRGDFAVNVEVLPPSKVTKKKVTLTVAGVVPLEDVTLVPQGKDMVGRVHLYVAVYDENGDLVSLVREKQDVRIPTAKVTAAGANVPARFGLTLKDLPRGEYTVSLTLLDEISDRYGTGLVPVSL
jgi:VWFA-related protein